MLDIHTHAGRLLFDRPFLTVETLIATLDQHGIEQACLMSVENPEEVDYFFTTFQVLEACARYPERLIPFCGLDPRHRYPETFDPFPILHEYRRLGCRGFGELLAGLPITHPLMQRLYAACGELGLPMILHLDHTICADTPGLEGLERMLQQYPQTVFIGHATRFWASISPPDGSDLHLEPYPAGAVLPGGALDRLLAQYANLYGDLSARSGYNALTRDPAFGLAFLERHQDKLLFGSDLLMPGQELPIVDFLRRCPISPAACEKITRQNAKRLLRW